MTEKERLLRLMYLAFLDIRAASRSQDTHTCFVLSDVFHNVPLQINRVEQGEGEYTEILTWIQRRCEERKCTSWLNNANADITRLP